MKRRLRPVWALVSGLLLWLSFPNPWAMDFQAWPGLLAWVALVPLMAVLEDCPPAEGARLGFVAGSAFFLPGLLWITYVRPLGLGAVPAWWGLAAWCALFVAAFGGLAAWGLRRGLRAPVLWLPALWTLLEALRGWLFTGFPWLSLGSSQFADRHLLPLAALTGPWGLDYAVALGNAVACAVLVWPAWLLSWRRTFSALAVLAALAVGARWQAGLQARWDSQGPPPGEARRAGIKVAVVQGGVDQDQAWNLGYRTRVLAVYLGLSLEAVRQGASLIVWPESSFPGFFNEGAPEADAVKAFARAHGVTLLVGSTLSTGGRYTNSAVLVSPSGDTLSYAKRHLVPFGEYVPLRAWLPVLDRLLDGLGVVGFTPGTRPGAFKVRGAVVSPLICYESVFPGLCLGGPPPDLLAILTDDTWYGDSPGPVWHASQAVMRAVENGCWVARAASTGVSLFASPDGRIRLEAGLGTAGVLVQTTAPARPTPWRAWGDWFLWACAGLLALSVAFSRQSVKNGV